MNPAGRIAVFAIGLLAVFAGAFGIGSLVEPADTKTEQVHSGDGHADHLELGERHRHLPGPVPR